MIEIVKKSNEGGDYLVTIAVGDKYLNPWKMFAFPLWEKYANKYDLGIMVVPDEEVVSRLPSSASEAKTVRSMEIKKKKAFCRTIFFVTSLR